MNAGSAYFYVGTPHVQLWFEEARRKCHIAGTGISNESQMDNGKQTEFLCNYSMCS